MSRKRISHATHTTSSSRSTSVLNRPALSSSAEMNSGYSPYSLIDNQTGKPNRNPARVDGRSGGQTTKKKESVSGRTEGHTGGQTNSQDDDEEEEADDEDNTEEPAVSNPASVRARHRSAADPERVPSQSHLAGQIKRSFSTALPVDAGEAIKHDGEEPDYPRKKVARHISTTSDGMLAYTAPVTTDDEDSYAQFDDEDFYAQDVDEDDDDIEKAEDAVLQRELENELTIEDLNTELFLSEWNHHRADNSIPFAFEAGGELFSVNASPVLDDDMDLITSEATAASLLPMQTSVQSPTSDDDDEESSEEEFDMSTFFDNNDSTVKLVGTHGNGEASETDDDVEYFFSSASSEDRENVGIDASFNEEDEDGDDEDDETDGGETTEEEENLPMPTPRSQSKLRRISFSSTTSKRPQVVRMDDYGKDGPRGCAWVADPSRPICVIEGSKRTILVPNGIKRFSISGESDSAASNRFLPMYESESEKSSVHPTFDPALGGLIGFEGGALNGSDILGPPEAFYPYMADGDVFADIMVTDDDADEDDELGGHEESDIDEGERSLKIDDFLDFMDFSSGDERRIGGKPLASQSEGGVSEDDGECLAGDSSAAMLSRWAKVSVTAFRKRQVQHLQKHNAMQNSGPQQGTKRDGSLAETITPTKNRRVRQRFLRKPSMPNLTN